jgi:hypothetical protein
MGVISLQKVNRQEVQVGNADDLNFSGGITP